MNWPNKNSISPRAILAITRARVTRVWRNFWLKIAHLSVSIATTPLLKMIPSYGLRPRLWLLSICCSIYCSICCSICCSIFVHVAVFFAYVCFHMVSIIQGQEQGFAIFFLFSGSTCILFYTRMN